MIQSRLGSFIEAIINVIIEFAINFIANMLIPALRLPHHVRRQLPNGLHLHRHQHGALVHDPPLLQRQATPAGKRGRGIGGGPVTRQRALQALGRRKTGVMNKTEAAYAATLGQQRMAGEVAWYKFEGIKLRLADNTF